MNHNHLAKDTNTNEIFKDLVVLELASVLAGPSVGLFFAELGAKVIKVENATTGGDVTRTWKISTEDPQYKTSAYYAAANWNKETLFLDLKQEKDQNIIYDLLPQVDIVVANFKDSAAQKMGMDANTLLQKNTKLIYANISGFGENDKDRVAFDVVLQAESGIMYMNGQQAGPATKMPIAFIDILAAHQLKEGVLCALIQRMRTGKGSIVNVSLFDAAVASLANQASTHLMTGFIPQRIGSLHPNIAPYGEQLNAEDGTTYVLAVGSNIQFQHLCELLNIPEVAKSPLYENNYQRVKNRVTLLGYLQHAFKKIDHEVFYEKCHQMQVPIGKVRDLQAVFELPAAQELILEQAEKEDNIISKRVKTAVFNIQYPNHS